MKELLQKTVEGPQVQFLDKVVAMTVVMQRLVPMVQPVQKTLEVSALQFIDKVVDIPVVAQRERDPPELECSEDHRDSTSCCSLIR